MTTEDAFYQTLEADPADVVTRLVFADWLEDQNPPRRVEANGQRWQVRNQQWPLFFRGTSTWDWWKSFGAYHPPLHDGWFEAALPLDIWLALTDWTDRGNSYVEYSTLRNAETALALALDELDL